MRRRTFGAALALGLLSPPTLAQARTYRIGILRPSRAPGNEPIRAAFRDLGYVPGRTVVFDEQFADGDFAALPALARNLVQAGPDLLIAVGLAATRAAQQASGSVPVVFFGNFDPLASGLVTQLARPGGNTTGIVISSEGTFAAKKLEFLKEFAPRARVAAMLAPSDPGVRRQIEEAQAAAPTLGLRLVLVEVRGDAYDEAFARIDEARADVLLVAAHTFFVRDAKSVIDRAAVRRLPAIYEWAEQARAGGLMAYGPDRDRLYRRVALHADRILKGASAGSLPIELPAEIELAINLRTAAAMGAVVPPSLLSRAHEVIE